MENKQNRAAVSAEMTIADIFSTFPEKSQRLAQEMSNFGLQCAGCAASTLETLEVGVLSHGYSEQELESLIKSLNAIIDEPLDSTTISFTPKGAERFKEVLKGENKEGWGLRLSDKPGGCGGFEYILDFSEKASDEDTVFLSHGIEIYVAKARLSRLLGALVDYVDGLNGAGFKISNPNVQGSCSCGRSQSY
ncbi:iron-sulfur cluster assembly accessory protein [Candidatus Aerophobetes bacterium]|uniref:Iron-sulfur cluster assembly accessory protein n=1 Tax=Aerophobetes bacterium TaxID=2030807 RepID=A0A2A4X157_UNCAE|nr:MAG: iron-sulfur cluster assembly accessory protein [Candidatus Aerophobetes bacterium]